MRFFRRRVRFPRRLAALRIHDGDLLVVPLSIASDEVFDQLRRWLDSTGRKHVALVAVPSQGGEQG